jgi:hypothetical protein
MDIRNGPDNPEVLLKPVAFVALVTFPITGVAFTNGTKVVVGDTVLFPGSFFGWATHPVARIQPTAMNRASSVIIFIGGSPF